jgi:hypothetical protein
MAEPYVHGERLFLSVHLRPPRRDPRWPATRPVWVYVLDPASIGLREPVARIEVPYEPLEPGPCGTHLEVEHRPLPDFVCQALDWPPRLRKQFDDCPLHLDDPWLAVDGGVRPSTGQPIFAGQMVYAVCQRVHDTFRRALGRWPTWGPWAARSIRQGRAPRLKLRPFAFKDSNACYDPLHGSIEFGAFEVKDTDSPTVLPGGMVFLALSHDVIAHEMTHALLDGVRAHLLEDTNPDVPAFHEAFADLVALFHHFRYPEVVEHALEQAGGRIDADVLFGLAREFGEALHGEPGKALRRAAASMRRDGPDCAPPLRLTGDEPGEPHERGAVLVSAIFTAYAEVFERKAAPLFRLAHATQGPGRTLPHELITLLADEACQIADEFLHVCIRAIDYCPPMDLRFGEYLRALVTADVALNPSDRLGVRDELIKAFRRCNVDFGKVLDLSQYSLEWNGPGRSDLAVPGLAWSELAMANDGITPADVREVERQAAALARFALGSGEAREAFGLVMPGKGYGPIVVESIRPAVRRNREGRIIHGLVAELSQQRERGGRRFAGGATVVLNEEGVLLYAIRKRVDDDVREETQLRYLAKRQARFPARGPVRYCSPCT